MEAYFETGQVHPYFNDFKKVSPMLYELLGVENGAAHTDIIKCSSNSFPIKGMKKKDISAVVNNCTGYFVEQLRQWRPKLIICNGSLVCKLVKQLIKPKTPIGKYDTSYIGEFEGNKIYVILSGFIGVLIIMPRGD